LHGVRRALFPASQRAALVHDDPMNRWIDTHCHLDAAEFDADRVTVRERAAACGVAHCVVPAVEPANFDTVRLLAHQTGDSYALGIHPLWVNQVQPSDLDRLGQALAMQANDPRLVAVGEIGLDHFVAELCDSAGRARQMDLYRAQLALARRHDLPVLLHVRRSADSLLKALRATPVAGGIAHAFNGSEQQAHAFIALGFKLGFGGAMTHERALQLRRLAQVLPLEALVLETDAPDSPPHWLYRTAEQRAGGAPQGRNEPAELPRIAAVMAGLRGMTEADLALATTRNACVALPRLAALLAGPL
jgi:TatD DNase family protein